jgi:cyanophycinase-like exopeptidase
MCWVNESESNEYQVDNSLKNVGAFDFITFIIIDKKPFAERKRLLLGGCFRLVYTRTV